MADLSSITLPSGATYDIKDAQARDDISVLQQANIDIERAEAAADRAEAAAEAAELGYLGVTVQGTTLVFASTS